mmetsp:Transcript_67581/g.187418  ORF Transcript_67581/g.187418 Transcript_67581/m.187418 type:complete len:211 (+) Transcript_67581:479-1111(+)
MRDDDEVLPVLRGLMDVVLDADQAPPVAVGYGLGPLARHPPDQLETAFREQGVPDADAQLLGHGLELRRRPVGRPLLGHGLLPDLPHLLVDQHREAERLGDLGSSLQTSAVRRGHYEVELGLLVQLRKLFRDVARQLDASLRQGGVERPGLPLIRIFVRGVDLVAPLAVAEDDQRLRERRRLLLRAEARAHGRARVEAGPSSRRFEGGRA